jgi:hypothetical protein
MGSSGVFVQKTNHGGGSAFIRGLTGNQLHQSSQDRQKNLLNQQVRIIVLKFSQADLFFNSIKKY